jgi:hypothetical protein
MDMSRWEKGTGKRLSFLGNWDIEHKLLDQASIDGKLKINNSSVAPLFSIITVTFK